MPKRHATRPRSAELAGLARALEQMRKQAGLSQEQLAKASGIDRTSIARFERGVGNPSYITLLKITEALEVPLPALTALALMQTSR